MLFALPLCLAAVALAAGEVGGMFSRPAELASERALKYLAGTQREDGAWELGNEETEPDVGVTALAGMAFMSEGSTPARGRYIRRSAATSVAMGTRLDVGARTAKNHTAG